MAKQGEQDSLVLQNGNINYGTVPKNYSSENYSKCKVYCVHGESSDGCCKVLEGEVINIQLNDESILTNTKENANTAKMVNEHCHRRQSSDVDKKARKKLIIASVLCLLFMVAEIIGGYISNSLAIASDAAHLLTDFGSFMISLFSIWMANRPSTKNMSFGWYRAEVIGALTSLFMIWIVTGVLVYLAIERLQSKTFDIDTVVMLITSGIGVVVNLIMGFTLHEHGHSHGGVTDAETKKHKNINVRAAFIHVIGDFLQSFGVFVAAVIIYFREDWNIIDPICTFIFSIIVVLTTFSIIKDILLVLMEGLPKGIDFEEVMNVVLYIDGVKKVHNLRIWALSLDKIAMSAHIAINPDVNPQDILMVATKNIYDKYGFFEMTLQIEEFRESMEACSQCQNPK